MYGLAVMGSSAAQVSSHGTLYMWGDGTYGQSGHGIDARVRQPRKLSADVWEGHTEREEQRIITVSAEEEGGRVFRVRRHRQLPLQAAPIFVRSS